MSAMSERSRPATPRPATPRPDAPKLMAHLVAHYPSADLSAVVADALVEAGADFLEVQFPYTDPTADGPLIQGACTTALDQGFSVRAGFAFVSRLAKAHRAPIFLMSYAGMVYARGIHQFVAQAADAGVAGIIVPDLPIDSDEGIVEAAKSRGIAFVPVAIPTMAEKRLELLEGIEPEYVYAALRRGITGQETVIGQENVTFLDRLRKMGPHIMAGFGIRTAEQIAALAGHVDTVVVGSAIVEAVGAAAGDAARIQSGIHAVLQSLRNPTNLHAS